MENGVFILLLRNEIRVAYSDEFIDLFGNFNDEYMNYDINREVLERMFGAAEVFQDYGLALTFGQELAKNMREVVGELDNGIMVLNYNGMNFEDL